MTTKTVVLPVSICKWGVSIIYCGVQDYLGGSKEVHSIVQQFLGETSKQVLQGVLLRCSDLVQSSLAACWSLGVHRMLSLQGGQSVVQQRAVGRDQPSAGKPRSSSRQVWVNHP